MFINEDAEHYYWTPMLRFTNRIDSAPLKPFYDIKIVEHQCGPGKETTVPAAVVCWRVIDTGTFIAPFDLAHFPLDTQELSLGLVTGAHATVHMLAARDTCRVSRLRADWDIKDVRLVRNMKQEYRSVVQSNAFVQNNEYELSHLLHMMPDRTIAADSSTGVRRASLRIQMRIRRRPAYWCAQRAATLPRPALRRCNARVLTPLPW